MLQRLKALFEGVSESEPVDSEAAVHVAAAVLLIQIARADQEIEAEELERIRAVLKGSWGVPDADLDDLMQAATDSAENNASLHEEIELINQQFSPAQKVALMRGLWDVACSDGRIHHHEELLVRRLAELMYVSHTDFIRTKHEAIAAPTDR